MQYLEWQQKLKQQLVRAWIYPSLLGSVMLGLICILMVVVMPQLQYFLTSNQQTLPLSTKLLLIVAEIFQNNFLIVAGLLAGGFLILVSLRAFFLHIRELTDRLKISIPYLGKFLLLIDIERFIYTLHILFKGNVPLLECLQHARDSVKNTWLQKRLIIVQLRIQQGELFSSALQNEKVFLDTLPRLIAVGERAGNLEKALAQAGVLFNQILKRRIENLLALLEPVLILILGLILMWIAVAVFLPLYDNLGQIL